MTLVDTSVWIDFLLGRDLPHVRTLEALIRADEDLALCGLVLTEVLQGIRDDVDHERTRTRLSPLLLLRMEEPVFLKAAEIYRTLRKEGVTIRGTNDCLIAAVAILYGVALLHADADFEKIARVYPLETAVSPLP